LHFYALIDSSPSMDFGEPTKLHCAKQLAAALGFIGLVRGDRVRIETLGQPAHKPAPVLRGRQSLWRLLDHLESLEPGDTTSLAGGVKNFCIRNPGKGILVLISDLMDKQGYETALRYLVAREMDVYIVHVLSAEEIEPEIKGDLRLVDCEDGDAAEITVSAPLIAKYRRTLAAFIDGAKTFCNRRGMAYLLARNDLPIDQIITRYLRNRGLVR
ncbi:MAG TPA: DUF58 domain-containing protein, partial [Pirellulales bacterium]|nr:DUF58 domain-containing protein [Pirellulales bacterium]